MSKVVTVQDYLIRKDPEKYEPIFKEKEKVASKAAKKDDEKRKLLAEIQALREENEKLVAENKKLKAEKKKT